MPTELRYENVDMVVAEAPAGMTKFKMEFEEPGIAILTLDRPDKLNAFSMGYPADQPRPRGWSMYDRYMRCVTQELKHDPKVRVVVVTGAGRAFSSGADIKDWAGMEAHAKTEVSPFVKEGLLFDEHTAMMHIWFKHLVKPTIAMVNGLAVGMGADLAGACDMRIMSDEAFFQWAYILNGLVPVDGGMWLLPRIVGQAKAMEWMLTGDRVYAEEALRTGLVNHVVPKEKLLETTMALAAKIAERSPSAVQSTRFGINAGATLSMQDAVGLSYLSGYSTFRDMRSSIQRRAENI
ncbi:MAG: enoyl-CoA hydratase/isomerase family protein [Phenylobacterium sp.]|nr:enoyl-CoA hydratase/isomerase family protein [Phenylobacterium sp.]